jgi:hypothetical protein
MLYSLVHAKTLIDHTPHQEEFAVWKSRLDSAEIQGIFRQISDDIDRATDAPGPSFFSPLPDWSKKEYRPIFLKACQQNNVEAQRCFAVFVWEVFRRKEDDWAFRLPDATKTVVEKASYYRI